MLVKFDLIATRTPVCLFGLEACQLGSERSLKLLFHFSQRDGLLNSMIITPKISATLCTFAEFKKAWSHQIYSNFQLNYCCQLS